MYTNSGAKNIIPLRYIYVLWLSWAVCSMKKVVFIRKIFRTEKRFAIFKYSTANFLWWNRFHFIRFMYNVQCTLINHRIIPFVKRSLSKNIIGSAAKQFIYQFFISSMQRHNYVISNEIEWIKCSYLITTDECGKICCLIVQYLNWTSR